MVLPSFPTGAQYEISAGDHTAVVCEVGATLRSLQRTRADGAAIDLIRGFAPEEAVDADCRGQQLLPWPNRIRDGRWTWQEVEHQLPLSEVSRHNAIHGLVRWVPWELITHRPDAVTQRLVLRPQHGWPGTMEALLTHQVGPDGLHVDVVVVNQGADPMPFGYGVHPYLTVGESDFSEVELESPATQRLVVDDRLLPVRLEPVSADQDMRRPRPLAGRDLDTAYTGLGGGRRWQVVMRRGDRETALWADKEFGWLQLYTGAGHRGGGLAVEPMTCGPDALNPGPTHQDLIVLRPGARFAGSWGIRGH
ncbi:aldose 1-epimerase family protein [Propionibacteriaceae bacterium Y2011]|uniref:aldose 1-epimerase family protein n=1 Tax=Microlunatus sp. Y2014 TaxID=3418488 RepID=UPI003B4F19C7